MNKEQKTLLRENWVYLTNNLECTPEFLNHFVTDRILTEDSIDEIIVSTFQYDLADILRPDLAPSDPSGERMIQETARQPGGSGTPGSHHSGSEEVDRPPQQAVDEFSDDDVYLDESREDMDNINLRVVPVRRALRDWFTSDQVYPMSEGIRGRALIINNHYFSQLAAINSSSRSDTQSNTASTPSLSHRYGSDKDVENIKRCFKALKFEFNDVYSDLKKQEIIETIEKEKSNPSHEKYGMFLLVLMSHGSKDLVYGADGNAVELDTIYSMLSARNFRAMKGKPKVIVVQACSGEKKDTLGYTTDGPHHQSDSRPPMEQSRAEPLAATQPAAGRPDDTYAEVDDFYVMKASFQGFVSTRHERQGSWFIRALIEALYKHSGNADIRAIFDQVQKKVRNKSIKASSTAYKQGNTIPGSQVPIDMCTLRKKLYLFSGYK